MDTASDGLSHLLLVGILDMFGKTGFDYHVVAVSSFVQPLTTGTPSLASYSPPFLLDSALFSVFFLAAGDTRPAGSSTSFSILFPFFNFG
jgi:hypothetical protein